MYVRTVQFVQQNFQLLFDKASTKLAGPKRALELLVNNPNKIRRAILRPEIFCAPGFRGIIFPSVSLIYKTKIQITHILIIRKQCVSQRKKLNLVTFNMSPRNNNIS